MVNYSLTEVYKERVRVDSETEELSTQGYLIIVTESFVELQE